MEIKIFNQWDVTGIEVSDPGVKPYISLHSQIVPRSFGRHNSTRFGKSKSNIVERLMGKLQVPGHRGKVHRVTSEHCTGKGLHTYNVVYDTFKIVEKETGKNPVAVFVKALENAAPREEITTIEYGGARYPQAVECAPQRRIDIALRQMVQGAYSKCFNKKVRLERTLADEIIKAYNMDPGSQAISKKLELERQSDSSR